jgi:GNAT superfamily N-acetyltransferase
VTRIAIKPYEPKYWATLWQLRAHQLAEAGIEVDPDPGPPDLSSPYERDYHRMDQVYLRGAGGVWFAWWDHVPVGHVAGQDWGGGVELRRMYVRAEYRRRGVGTRLVVALIEHCVTHGVTAIELWTAQGGPGRLLYEKSGFRETGGPGKEFRNKEVPCPHSPSDDEIRMRLDLD